uniref:Potassium/proton antiporter CemA n=1 Tax=Chloromonas perforata TaxID=51730 RepID=A0A0S2LPD8_9CHLO|nr:chloroplast enveloppe membrane protein [Chloromonas perforata]
MSSLNKNNGFSPFSPFRTKKPKGEEQPKGEEPSEGKVGKGGASPLWVAPDGFSKGVVSPLPASVIQQQEQKQEVVSITYEEIGLFPRSFSRVLDRFLKQVFSDVENLVIQEYRFYRYLFLTTLKCLLILFFIPFFVNFLAKTYVVRPLTEYFWNTKQTEIFLNSYQQKRAFAELKEFEEKTYFESLIFPKSVFVSNFNSTYHPIFTSDELPLVGEKTEKHVASTFTFSEKESKDVLTLSPNQKATHSFPFPEGKGRSNPFPEGKGRSNPYKNRDGRNTLFIKGFETKPFIKSGLSLPPGVSLTQPLHPRLSPKVIQPLLYITEGNQNPTFKKALSQRLKTQKEQGLNTLSEEMPSFSQTSSTRGEESFFQRQKKRVAYSPSPPLINKEGEKKENPFSFRNPSIAEIDYQGVVAPKQTEHFINSYNMKSSLFVYQTQEADKNIQQRYQEKTIELAQRYNDQSIEAITNLFADLISLLTLFYLLYALEIQINITKSFLLEVFFGLDDSKKSLLILLITDLLVGYHSSNLWELFFEFLFHHYGLPESQTGIFLLVATLPVLLDVLFKYLIFRHLNRSSPATVATYHAMIE